MGTVWSFEYLEKDCNGSGHILGFVTSHIALLNIRNQNKRQTSGYFALIFNKSFSLHTKLHIV